MGQKAHNSEIQARVQRELFIEDNEQRIITIDAEQAAPQAPAAD